MPLQTTELTFETILLILTTSPLFFSAVRFTLITESILEKEVVRLLTYLSTFSIIAAIMLVIGIALVILEMFIPGFGVPGISGIVLIAAGIVIQAKSIEEGLILLLVVLAILGIALFIMLFTARKGHFPAKNLVLDASIHPESEDLEYFIDREGVALTPLRPAGKADFDGVRLDVVSDGEFVAVNERIRVVRTEGNRIIVRRIG